MLIQLYAIFPLLMKASRKRGIRVIIITGILAWTITLIVNPFLDLQKYNLNYFFIGHLPVFCLGILFAQMKYFKLPNSVIALCLLVLIFGNLFDIIWPFTMLAAALLIIILSLKLQRTLKKYNRFSSSITIIGANSLYLFLVHGFLREPFVAIAQQHDNPFITILSGLAFLVLSLIVAWCIRKASTSIQHRADKLLIR